jgi:hypothetical protein
MASTLPSRNTKKYKNKKTQSPCASQARGVTVVASEASGPDGPYLKKFFKNIKKIFVKKNKIS